MKLEYNFKMKVDDDLFTSVFNSRENEVRKAFKAFEIIYGKRELKKLKNLIKDKKGLLGIFDIEADDKLVTFALLITQAQNQRRI